VVVIDLIMEQVALLLLSMRTGLAPASVVMVLMMMVIIMMVPILIIITAAALMIAVI